MVMVIFFIVKQHDTFHWKFIYKSWKYKFLPASELGSIYIRYIGNKCNQISKLGAICGRLAEEWKRGNTGWKKI